MDNCIVYQWHIDHFSCWNCEIHNNVMETRTQDRGVAFRLRRTVRRKDHLDRLYVEIRSSYGNLKGELSLLRMDGSLISNRQVNSDTQTGRNEYGILFEELLAHMRENQPLHNSDRLTVRFCCKGGEKSTYFGMHSTLDVRTTSLKISLPSLLNDIPPFGRCLSTVEFPDDSSILGGDLVALKVFRGPFHKIELKLDSVLSVQDKIFVRSHMSVVNNDGLEIRNEENAMVVQNRNLWTLSNSLTIDEVIQENATVLLSLKMVISGKITHLYNQTTPSSKLIVPTSDYSSWPPEKALTVLSQDFMGIYHSEGFSDVRLHCHNVIFSAHKNILSARSPVFNAMFSCDMSEATSGTVHITDLDSSTLGRFLRYLYSGTIGNDLQEEEAFKLYYAADKYEVPLLKSLCSEFLSVRLSISNVCNVLSLADRHQDDRLITAAHCFILKNFNQVLSSQEWENLAKMDHSLTSKTVILFAKKLYLKSVDFP